MSDDVSATDRPRRGDWYRKNRLVIFWGACGFVGYFIGKLLARTEWLAPLDPTIDAVGALGFWAGLGWATIVILAISGVYLGIASLRARWVRWAMELDPHDAIAKPKRMLQLGALGLICYAALILVFLLPDVSPVAGITVGAVAFAAVTALFFASLRISDELQAAAAKEACYWTFVVVEAVLIGWALLYHFDQAGPLQPLPLVLLLVLSYAVASLVVSIRRGLTD